MHHVCCILVYDQVGDINISMLILDRVIER